MTISEYEKELSELNAKILPLTQRRGLVIEALMTLRSQEFIRVNNITKDDVELPDGEGKPWWNDVYRFGEWLRSSDCKKRFCAWNGMILFTQDLRTGQFNETAGRVEHVPGLR